MTAAPFPTRSGTWSTVRSVSPPELVTLDEWESWMRRWWAVAAVAVAALVSGACTDDARSGVPSAGGGAASPSGGPDAASSSESRFVACMREQGIADMPDPIPGDTSGRSSVRYALDVMGKGSDEVFQAALNKCQSLLPAPEPEKPPTAQDQNQALKFAQCMREHGVEDFPDPKPGATNSWLSGYQPNGGGKVVLRVQDSNGETRSISDPDMADALKACGEGGVWSGSSPSASTD